MSACPARRSPFPKVFLVLFCCVVAARAQDGLPAAINPITARSRSGQFVIRGGATGVAAGSAEGVRSANLLGARRIAPVAVGNLVELEPRSAAVSCERIKDSVLRLLRMRDAYRGKITLQITGGSLGEGTLRIVSAPFSDGWQYTMPVPARLEWPRFVRGIVEVLLLEVANRADPEKLVQPPLWLTEGVTGLVLAGNGRELVPELNREFKDAQRRLNPLADAMRDLAGEVPLGVGALSFPVAAVMDDAGEYARYRASATLFVHELNGLAGEAGTLGRFAMELARGLNWQTTFFERFRGRFQTALELEKWWAVHSASLTARDPANLWSAEAVMGQLVLILTETAVEGHGSNAPVSIETTRLSAVVESWPYPLQQPVLDRKLAQLRQMFQLAPPGSAELVASAYQILDEYRRGRQGTGEAERRGVIDPRGRVLARTAARRLGSLEARVLGP
jgi:hypothetical protein